MAASQLAFLFQGRLILMVHGEQAPSQSEWDALLAEINGRRDTTKGMRTLVFSSGGAPNLSQREGLRVALNGQPCPTAVLTNSTIARTVMSIIRLRNPTISAFSPDEIDRAFEFLELTDEERRWAQSNLPLLKKSVVN